MFVAAKKTQKVSLYVVETIRDAILAAKFKPGDRLASEKELIDQFQVSKASMREALRVLEGMGLIEIKKGIGGGVFVAEVDMNTAINGLTNFLHFRNVSVGNVTMLRYLLEPHLAFIAASKVSEGDVHILETLTGQEASNPLNSDYRGLGFHRHIAKCCENPLLVLIVDFTESLVADLKVKLKPGADFFQEVEEDHHKIIECLKQKDGDGARREMTHHILRVDAHLARLSGESPFTSNETPVEVRFQPEPATLTDLQGLHPEGHFGVALRRIYDDLGLILKDVGTGALDPIEFDARGVDRAVVNIGKK